MDSESVALYYSKALDGEWYLMEATASKKCIINLNTSGHAYLCNHPLPESGFNKHWKHAKFVGTFTPAETGWEGTYEGTWTEWS